MSVQGSGFRVREGDEGRGPRDESVIRAGSLDFRACGLSARLAGVFLVVALSGCSQYAAPGPADNTLRELAATYVRQGVRYPEHPVVRAEAVEAAAKVMGRDALLLVRGAMKDEHPAVRFAACMAMGRLKDPDAAPTLRELLKDEDPSVRVGVYFALERLGDTSHRVEWVELLRRHENPVVRRNAAMALGLLEDKKSLPLLELAANSDPDEGVKLQALEGMARLGDRDAISQFLQYAIAGQSFRQPYALITLAYIKDERVAPALRTRLESSPYLESRLAAARSLGVLGYADGYDLALASLNWKDAQPNLRDDPPEVQIMRVRSMAAMALGEIGDRRALDALAKRMQTPDDPRVQLAAATAILMILNGPVP
jgi:HEAT repeat protein